MNQLSENGLPASEPLYEAMIGNDDAHVAVTAFAIRQRQGQWYVVLIAELRRRGQVDPIDERVLPLTFNDDRVGVRGAGLHHGKREVIRMAEHKCEAAAREYSHIVGVE